MSNISQITFSDLSPETVNSLIQIVKNKDMSIYKLALRKIYHEIHFLHSDTSWIAYIIFYINDEIYYYGNFNWKNIFDIDTLFVNVSPKLVCEDPNGYICTIKATLELNYESILDLDPRNLLEAVKNATINASHEFCTKENEKYSDYDYVGRVFHDLSSLKLGNISVEDFPLVENEYKIPEKMTLTFSIKLK